MTEKILYAAVLALSGFIAAWIIQDWRYGEQLAEIELAQAQARAAFTAQARAKEQAHAKQLNEAQHAAKDRETKLLADAGRARSAANGLRDELAAIRSNLPSLAADACRIQADRLADVFGSCSQRYSELAADADRIASERQTLIDAWPKD